MKATVYSVEGKKTKDIELPKIFEEPFNATVLIRTVTSLQSKRLQPYGSDPRAGLKTTATYIGRRAAYRTGINRGIARLPRVKLGGGGLGAVKRVPHSVGGRRAHPPKVEKILVKKVNDKERKMAIRIAIAATASNEIVLGRGHKFSAETLPVIVEDNFAKISKTVEAVKAMNALGLGEDLSRGKQKTIRAGIGKMRGKKYKRKKSVLVVLSNDDTTAAKACKNIPGVDVVNVQNLNAELLAPGTHAGRLTLWTESAVTKVGELFK